MRIVFLHLSDLHFETTGNISDKHINEIATALSRQASAQSTKFLFL